jgi:hypothetical protein
MMCMPFHRTSTNVLVEVVSLNKNIIIVFSKSTRVNITSHRVLSLDRFSTHYAHKRPGRGQEQAGRNKLDQVWHKEGEHAGSKRFWQITMQPAGEPDETDEIDCQQAGQHRPDCGCVAPIQLALTAPADLQGRDGVREQVASCWLCQQIDKAAAIYKDGQACRTFRKKEQHR